MPPKKDDPQVLPPKDALVFKQILQNYELKQYKKALKSCDNILKRFPTHGETSAMKGLIFSQMKEKKEEALSWIKKGLAFNIKSHICWHVYGLYYRQDQKYEDAVKCYQNAMKRDPENLQILKDLSLLQIQRRLLSGFEETRRRILQLKANNRHNWIAFAIGAHLCKKYKKALNILDAYEKSQAKEKQDAIKAAGGYMQNYDDSETKLYYNQIIEESGDFAAALAHLDKSEQAIVDKLYAKEKKAFFHLKLGHSAEAEKLYKELIDINPDSYKYHFGLQESLGLLPANSPFHSSQLVTVNSSPFPYQTPNISTVVYNTSPAPTTSNITTNSFHVHAPQVVYTEQQVAQLTKLYQSLEEQYLYSSACRRLPLDFLPAGEEFSQRVEKYLRKNIKKGVPSLFSDLSSLYQDKSKAKIIQDITARLLKNLRARNSFDETNADEEAPTALLWCLYFVSQQADLAQDYQLALTLADEAITHTPTIMDFYMLKARIYKHAGDAVTAFGYMDTARKMDTQDRYLNTKCVRYALRADNVKAAEEIVSLFLRDGDGLKALADLQVNWYELQAAATHIRMKRWGPALKKLVSIEKHFNDFIEDLFDFHSYVLRKTTLRSYVDTLRWQDQVFRHRFFFRAALMAVQVYLKLHDLPIEEEDERKRLQDNPNLSEEEKKAEARRQKRAANKAKAAEEKTESKPTGGKQAKKDDDPDPDGALLAKTETPLNEAARWLKHLHQYLPDEPQTHHLAIQVYIRKEKWLLALRHVTWALSIAPEHPETHYGLMMFLHRVQPALALEGEKQMHPVLKKTIEEEIATSSFGNGSSVESLNEAYLSKHRSSLPHVLSAARVIYQLTRSNEAVQKAATLVTSFHSSAEHLSRSDAETALTFLTEALKLDKTEHAGVQQFVQAMNKRFPFAVAFGAVSKPPQPIDQEENNQ